MNQKYDWESSLRGTAPTQNQNTYIPEATHPPVQGELQYVRNMAEIKRKNEKKVMRRLGNFCGLALVGYLFVQTALSVFLELFGLLENYTTDPVYQGAVDTVLTVLGLFLPYAFFGRFMEKTSLAYPLSRQRDSVLNLGKPKSGLDFLLAVLAGLGLCMMANIATSFFTVFMELFGYKLTSPELALPTDALGIFLTFMRVSILAGFIEEVCLRGYTMGSLRIFGDKTAILFSSIVFAMMHGNLVQSPFALIAGIAIGYLSIKTGSIWTGIVIHALNNFISVVISYVLVFSGEEAANTLYAVILYGLMIFGLIALVIFTLRTREDKLETDKSSLSLGSKLISFFLNPAMIIAAIYMLYVTGMFVEKTAQ